MGEHPTGPTSTNTEVAIAVYEPQMVKPMVTSKDLISYQTDVIEYIKSTLHEHTDYGAIPGTNKDIKVLLKPGAELLCKSAYLIPEYEILEKTIDHEHKQSYEKKVWNDKTRRNDYVPSESVGLYNYVIKCRLLNQQGIKVGEGIGSCSTMESKYISRPRDSENTVIKMAKKRAFVDATLTAFSLSGRFTQDVEDSDDYNNSAPPRNERGSQSVQPTSSGKNKDTQATRAADGVKTTKPPQKLYQGTTEEQKKFKIFLADRGISSEHWLTIHEKMIGKPDYKLLDVLTELGLDLRNVTNKGTGENSQVDVGGMEPPGDSAAP